MAEIELQEVIVKIKPYVLGWIGDIVADPATPTNHSGLAQLDYASSGHTGFEPSVTKGNLSAGSNKITIDGTPTGALIGAGASIDVNQANLDHGSIGGLGDDDHTQYASAEGSGTRRGYEAGRLNKTITAGTGLSGGGALTADRTLSVDTTYAFTWGSLHTFNAGATIAAGQNLGFGADVAISRKGANILQINSGDVLQSNSYASGISGWNIGADGTAEFSNVRVRGELVSTVFKYNEIQATAGTFGVFKSASNLYADCAVPASGAFTISAKNADGGGALFATNDVLRMKDWNGAAVRDVWATVTGVTNQGAYSDYACTLSYGSASITITAGAAVVDYGPSGAGFLTLSADGAVGSSANMSIADHAGSPWSATTLRARLGNLNGSYGRTSDLYGIGLGDYANSNYMSYDGTSGFTLKAGGGQVGIDANGINMTNDTGVEYVQTSNEGAIKWYNGATLTSRLSGYSGGTGGADNGDFLEINVVPRSGKFGYTILSAGASSDHHGFAGLYAYVPANGVSLDSNFLLSSWGTGNIEATGDLTISGGDTDLAPTKNLILQNNGRNLAIGQASATEKVEVTGNVKVSGSFISAVASGTQPVQVTSTTKNDNLNADLLDGYHAASFGRWTFYSAPKTSTSWDGDAYSTVNPTTMDVNSVFGVTSGAKAVLVRLECRDSGSASDSVFVNLGLNATYPYLMINRPHGGDLKNNTMGVIPLDSGNVMGYRIGASGASTMDVWIEIWGELL
jgi:hypothetical protein